MLCPLPSYTQPQKRLTDRFNTHQTLGKTLLEADFRCKGKRPHTGLFPINVRRFMQDRVQRFTFGLIKVGLHCFWPRRFVREAYDDFLLKGVDRIADSLGRTAQILGDDFGTLFSTGGEQDLAAAQGKGIR